MNTQTGSKKERADDEARRRSFCRLQALLCNPREAAILAGYPSSKALAIAADLLADDDVTGQIDSYRKAALEQSTAHEALAGLQRLAFGSVNDALFLALSDPDAPRPDTRALDLFNVSEIEIQKGGGTKIKFYNRLDAMLALLKLCPGVTGPDGQPVAQSSQSAVLQALRQSAAAVERGGGYEA